MFGIKTKIKKVKKYLQLINVFHCLRFICLYEKTHKSLKAEILFKMLLYVA